MGIPLYGDLISQLSPDELPQLRNQLNECDKLDIVYWVCAFSINQHSLDKYQNGHPKCEVDKFDGMFDELVNENTSGGGDVHHVVAVDQHCDIFSRAWVVAEMIQADIIQARCDNLKQRFSAFGKESLETLIK